MLDERLFVVTDLFLQDGWKRAFRNGRTCLILSLPLMADRMLNIPWALRLSTSRALARSPIQRPGDTSSMDMESKEEGRTRTVGINHDITHLRRTHTSTTYAHSLVDLFLSSGRSYTCMDGDMSTKHSPHLSESKFLIPPRLHIDHQQF